MPFTHILGIDIGGTKAEALLVRTDGRIVGAGRCDAFDPRRGTGDGGAGRSDESVAAAVSEALGRRRIPSLALGGREALPPGVDLSRVGAITPCPVPEWAAALALAGADHGFVLVAGTGALVHGAVPDGRSITLDGLGPHLGDYGSASMIGQLAVRAAARSSFGPQYATSLAEAVPAALAAFLAPTDPPFNIVAYMLQHRDRAEIASLAALTDAHARAGDPIARSILRAAAAAAAETLCCAVRLLDAGASPLPVVAVGSVARRSDLYWSALRGRLRRAYPALQPVRPDLPPVVGVALAAAARAGLAANPNAFRRTLIRAFNAPEHNSEGENS